MMDQRKKVVEIAHTWLGTPYRHHGLIKHAGVDCLTLLVGVFQEAGLIDKIDLPYYPPDWHLHRTEEKYLEGLLQYTHEVNVPLPGDIALFRIGHCYSHGAIVVEWPVIIHAYIGRNCILDNVETSTWLTHIGEAGKDLGKKRPRKFFSYWNES